MMTIIATGLIAAILVAAAAAQTSAQEAIPACDSAETESLFIKTVNKNLATSMPGLEALVLLRAQSFVLMPLHRPAFARR